MKKIVITGIAENSKAGAIVIAKNKDVYYIEGLQSWNDDYFKKNVVVEGNLVIENNDEGVLMNDKGEYKQGLSGEIKKISKPKWKMAIQLYENDRKLENLGKKLPGNWNMKIENEKLLITCNEQAYLLYENKINAPLNSETLLQKEERFKKYGKLINPQFVFILRKKLLIQETNNIKSENEKINEAIAKLHKQLKDIPVSAKDGNYWPRNKEEEKIVQDYEKERSDLEKEITKLPTYQSEKCALYIESEQGLETEFVSIFPQKYSEEMFKIKQEVFEKVLEPVE